MSDKVGVVDSYRLGEVLKPTAKKLGERCGVAAVRMLSNRLTEYIGSSDDDKYSYIWRSAIEEHEQDAHKDGSRSVLVDAVRDAALGATALPGVSSTEAVKVLLESSYPTLVRVGIYVSGENYGAIGDAFWECARKEWFDDLIFWHELYWFIKKGFPRFSVTQRQRFLDAVDNAGTTFQEGPRQEEWRETHKRDLLHPAHGLGDSEVDAKYQALVQRWGPVGEHLDFHTYTTAGWSGDRSPVTSDVLAQMSAEELRSLLTSFVPKADAWDGPSYRGLASALSAAVRASDDGFRRNIGMFSDLGRPYQHGLLRGLKERWAEDKREIDWPAAVSLMEAIVASATFSADLSANGASGWEPSVLWVVSDVADLIKSATEADRKPEGDLYLRLVSILRLVLDVVPKEGGKSDDAVSHALNSPRGRVLEALIHLALAMRRLEIQLDPSANQVWKTIRAIFETELLSSEKGTNAEFAAMAGMYCANFHFLNASWTESNFDRLFSVSNDSAWKCAAQGFSYQRYLFDWLFERLVNGGHLRKMIFRDDLPNQVSEKAIQFLGLAYLQGKEQINGGLLGELIISLRDKDISRLCWFFWTLREKGDASDRPAKILAFWVRVSDQMRERGLVNPKIFSSLSQLAIFVSDLSPEVVVAMTQAAPHAQAHHHGYLLVENLARLASRYPKEVASIYRAMLSGFLPDYRSEDVISCVTKIADAGQPEEAEWICNTYAERGSKLLDGVYDQIRANQRLGNSPNVPSNRPA